MKSKKEKEIQLKLFELRRNLWQEKMKASGVNIESLLNLEKTHLESISKYSKELQQLAFKEVETNGQNQAKVEKYLSTASLISICPDPFPPDSLPSKRDLIEGWVSKFTSPVDKGPRAVGCIREWEPLTILNECSNGRVDINKSPEGASTIICEGNYLDNAPCTAKGQTWVMSPIDGSTFQGDTHLMHDFQFHSLKSTEYRFTPEFYINGSLVKSIMQEDSENWAQINFYISVDGELRKQQNIYNKLGDRISYSEAISITSLDVDPVLSFIVSVDEGQSKTITIDCELFATAKDLNQVLIDLSQTNHYYKTTKLHVDILKKKIPLYAKEPGGDFAPPQDILDLIQGPDLPFDPNAF